MTARTMRVTLTVRDLTEADLPGLAWSGSPLHVANMARQLARARAGAMDYLVVVTATGRSVAKGGVDYETHPGAGSITEVAVRGELQSLGIGTFLVATMEERMRSRGLRRAELDVEENNPRARALYERLGYVAYDRALESWDQEGPDGTPYRYETMCTLMRKELAGR
jgi:ribosomal protein S18 acetylase RimI-like enzyme